MGGSADGSRKESYLERFERAAVLRPAGWRATVRSVHDSRVGASVQEQIEAADAVVLCRQVHGDRIDAMAFAAPVVAQIGIRAVVQQPGCGLYLVAVAGPQEWRPERA